MDSTFILQRVSTMLSKLSIIGHYGQNPEKRKFRKRFENNLGRLGLFSTRTSSKTAKLGNLEKQFSRKMTFLSQPNKD